MRNSRLEWRRVFPLWDLRLCVGVLRRYETIFRWVSSLLAEMSRHLSRRRKTVPAWVSASYGAAELSLRPGIF